MSRILLVEGEADVRELIVDAFEERHLDVRTAASDRAAYAVLDAEARAFDVLVADINLGEGTTGFDVADEHVSSIPNSRSST
ncbi:response regulator [Phenylobacterium deserti]|nr:response regulator [Phenylobacterium deserti]